MKNRQLIILTKAERRRSYGIFPSRSKVSGSIGGFFSVHSSTGLIIGAMICTAKSLSLSQFCSLRYQSCGRGRISFLI